MIRLLTAIFIVWAHCSWGTLITIDHQDKISSEKIVRYDKNTLYLEHKAPITKDQLNALIFPSDPSAFTSLIPVSDTEIEKQLTHLNVSESSPSILKQTTVIEYLANGRSKENTSLIVKLSRQEFDPTFLKYNPIDSDFKVKRVTHCTQSKEVQQLDLKCIKTIRLPNSGDKIDVYPKIRFTPGISLLYIEYELIHAFPKAQIDSTFKLVAQETLLTIMTPKNQQLHFNAAFGKPTIKQVNNPLKKREFSTYKWLISKTPKQPTTLYYTSYTKWSVLLLKYQQLLGFKIIDPTLVNQLVTELIPTNATNLTKTELLYNWIQTNITRSTDLTITTPAETLKNKRGNYKARILLLSALLKHVGIKNELDLVIPKGLPIVSDHFKNILCQVKLEDETYYLDLKNNYTRFPALDPELKDILLLNLSTQKIKKLTKKPAQFGSTSETKLFIELNENHVVSSKVSITMRGAIESNTRMILRQQYLMFSELFCNKTKIDQENQTDIIQVNASNFLKPLNYQATYSRKNQWIPFEDKILLFIPELEYFTTKTPSLTTFNISIKLPKGYQLVPQNEVSIADDKKEILNKTLTETQEGATIAITFNSIDISDNQKALIINELKKAIVLEIKK